MLRAKLAAMPIDVALWDLVSPTFLESHLRKKRCVTHVRVRAVARCHMAAERRGKSEHATAIS